MHYLAVVSKYFEGAGTLWALATIIHAMPPLPDNASWAARWAYGAVNALVANWDKVKATAQPPIK